MNDQWYRTSVIYEVDVKNFQDSNGDGVGDLPGLISRLDYVRSLGVDCLWLQPFYPSPCRDNGYDVSDYCAVDSQLGTMDDFDALVRKANALGLRVVIDLPLNHTSDQHVWFKEARTSRSSKYRDYYIWADKLPKNPAPYPVFGPEQNGNWEFDDAAKQYYFHTFYRFQPDLNMGNPVVHEELLKIAQFWMRRGVNGFRLDAVPFLVQDGAAQEHLEHPGEFLRALRSAVDEVRDDAVLIAEANLVPDQMRKYFGDGDMMHLLLNFFLCNNLFLSLATGEAKHVHHAWNALPHLPEGCGWANFVRNHDELSLDRLTEDQREVVLRAYGPDKNMQLYGRGIRRRFAPMVGGDLRKMKLMYAMLISLPGTPVINLGEELGMGDDLSLHEREAARTPMQWVGDQANAGFSTATRDRLVRPVVSGGEFGFQRVNVAAQEHDPESMLNFMRRVVKAFHATPAFGEGDWSFIETHHPGVLAHRCNCPDDRIYAFHNLTDQSQRIPHPLPSAVTELFSDSNYEPTHGRELELNPYGFRWFRHRD